MNETKFSEWKYVSDENEENERMLGESYDEKRVDERRNSEQWVKEESQEGEQQLTDKEHDVTARE